MYALFLEFGKGQGLIHQHIGVPHLDLDCEKRIGRNRCRDITVEEAAGYLLRDRRMLCRVCFPSNRPTSEIQIAICQQREVPHDH